MSEVVRSGHYSCHLNDLERMRALEIGVGILGMVRDEVLVREFRLESIPQGQLGQDPHVVGTLSLKVFLIVFWINDKEIVS